MPFKFSEKRQKKCLIFGKPSRTRSVARYVLPGLLKKCTDNKKSPKRLKKPTANYYRADDDSQKKKKSQSVVFMEKVHTKFGTEVCLSWLRPSLGTDKIHVSRVI